MLISHLHFYRSLKGQTLKTGNLIIPVSQSMENGHEKLKYDPFGSKKHYKWTSGEEMKCNHIKLIPLNNKSLNKGWSSDGYALKHFTIRPWERQWLYCSLLINCVTLEKRIWQMYNQKHSRAQAKEFDGPDTLLSSWYTKIFLVLLSLR